MLSTTVVSTPIEWQVLTVKTNMGKPRANNKIDGMNDAEKILERLFRLIE